MSIIHDQYESILGKITRDGKNQQQRILIGSKTSKNEDDYESRASPTLCIPSTPGVRDLPSVHHKKGPSPIHDERSTGTREKRKRNTFLDSPISTPLATATVLECVQSGRNKRLCTQAMNGTHRSIPQVKGHFRAIADSSAGYFILTARNGYNFLGKSRSVLLPRAVPTNTSNDHVFYLPTPPCPVPSIDNARQDAWSPSVIDTFGSLVRGTCPGPVNIRMRPTMGSMRPFCAGDNEHVCVKTCLRHEHTRQQPSYSSSSISSNASDAFLTSSPLEQSQSSFSPSHLEPPSRPPPRSSLFVDSKRAHKSIPYLPLE